MPMKLRGLLLSLLVTCGVAHAGPFDSLAARWAGDLKMSATNRSSTGVDNIFKGPTYGQIDTLGRLRFSLDNGCQISGNVTPASSSGKFDLIAKVTYCKVQQSNDVYTGTISPDGKKIIMTATAARMVVVGSDSLSFTTILAKY